MWVRFTREGRAEQTQCDCAWRADVQPGYGPGSLTPAKVFGITVKVKNNHESRDKPNVP